MDFNEILGHLLLKMGHCDVTVTFVKNDQGHFLHGFTNKKPSRGPIFMIQSVQ